MLGGLKLNTEDLLVKILLESFQLTIAAAHDILVKRDKKISLQAVYGVVNKLIDEGVLVKHGKQISVSREWVVRMQKILPGQSRLDLLEGESVQWSFANLSSLDAFWKHLVFDLFLQYPGEPVFMCGPHAFWPYAPMRSKSEEEFYQYFTEQRRHTYYAVGGNQEHDKKAHSLLKTPYVHIQSVRLSKLLKRHHFLVLENFVCTTTLTASDEQAIHDLYRAGEAFPDFLRKLTDRLASIGKARLLIENNSEKAAKLKKIIAKDFYITKI